MPSDTAPLLFNKRQAALALSVSTRTVERMGKQGLLPVVRLGKSVRYSVAGINSMIAALTQNASTDPSPPLVSHGST